MSKCHSRENTEIYSHTFLEKKFVKATHLLNKSLKSWIDEGKKFSTVHCDVKITEIFSFLSKTSWKQRIYFKLLKTWFHEIFFSEK